MVFTPVARCGLDEKAKLQENPWCPSPKATNDARPRRALLLQQIKVFKKNVTLSQIAHLKIIQLFCNFISN